MSVVIVGIDEAGYGPMLGPLTIGMASFELAGWKEGDAAPDLWAVLERAVCRRPNDKRARIAIDDSKTLKLGKDGKRHPLTHLERGVLGFVHAMGRPCGTDAQLRGSLSTLIEDHPWYGGDDVGLPLEPANSGYTLAANVLTGAMRDGGVTCLDLRCVAVCERKYNEVISRCGKPATTELGLLSHMRHAWMQWGTNGLGGLGGTDDATGLTRVVCDAQSGRIRYGDLLNRFLEVTHASGGGMEVLEESGIASRYRVFGLDADGKRRALLVSFQSEGEGRHLPIALASMVAKFSRELAMVRLNRHWIARAKAAKLAEVKPTAGYWEDSKRFLAELSPIMPAELRAMMMRIG